MQLFRVLGIICSVAVVTIAQSLPAGSYTFDSQSTSKIIAGDLKLRSDSTFRKVLKTITKVDPSDTSSNSLMQVDILEWRGTWVTSDSVLTFSNVSFKSDSRRVHPNDQIQLSANQQDNWSSFGDMAIQLRNINNETFQSLESILGQWIVWERE